MNENWTSDNIPDLSGKIIVITGANSGIGFHAAREFARQGAEVVFACRNQTKAEGAINQIRTEFSDAQLVFIELDLANLQSVKDFADTFNSRYNRLDILLNNAGVMMVPFGKTEDGFENTLGTNYLGHFALTGLLFDRLISTPGARLVNISSNAHYGGEIDFGNLMFEQGESYTPMNAYRRSKLANLLFTFELQRRLEKREIDVLALAAHPGISDTGLADHLFTNWFANLFRPLGVILLQSSAKGALPGIRAAVDPDAVSGQYYGPDGKKEHSGYPVVVDSSAASKDEEVARKLWEKSEELTGIQYFIR